MRDGDGRPGLYRRAFPAAWLTDSLTLSADPVVPLLFAFSFSFFLRVSEYAKTNKGVILLRQHVSVVDGRLVVHIPESKVDQERRGSFHARDGTGGPLCLVGLWRAYFAAHPRAGPDSPAFVFLDGRAVTDDAINGLIKSVAAARGADPLLYSSHSMRAGGASALYAAGADIALLIREGRWASIEGLLKYLRMDPTAAAHFAGSMVQPAPHAPLVDARGAVASS